MRNRVLVYALLAAAPGVSGTRPQSAFIGTGALNSLSRCLPLRGLRSTGALHPRSLRMSATKGYAQSRYIPAKVDSTISYEDIATFPRPGCSAPDSIAFSPDDSVVTYLASSDGSLSRQLYAMDIASGHVRELCKPPSGTGEEETFSLEEKLRRERARQLHTGITSYAWSDGAKEGGGKILVPIGNELFVQEGLDGALQRLFDPAVLLPKDAAAEASLPPILDARISADGKMVGFVWDRELYVVPTDCKSTPLQLTQGARGTELTNGLADYVAQEEMGRFEGYWISGDSSMAAFTQVDQDQGLMQGLMHMCVCVCVCVCMHMCMCGCRYVCACICRNTHTYTHKGGRKPHRQVSNHAPGQRFSGCNGAGRSPLSLRGRY